MAAEEHLSMQFFHGTTADLKPGDVIHPSSVTGKDNHPTLAGWRKQHAWVTDSEEGAWRYADLKLEGRKTAYEVEPMGPVKQRRRLDQTTPGREYSTPAARVKRRIDIPPPSLKRVYGGEGGPNGEDVSVHGVQGTLPGVDWPNEMHGHSRALVAKPGFAKAYGNDDHLSGNSYFGRIKYKGVGNAS